MNGCSACVVGHVELAEAGEMAGRAVGTDAAERTAPALSERAIRLADHPGESVPDEQRAHRHRLVKEPVDTPPGRHREGPPASGVTPPG
ncbi:hypothetical protein ACQPZA_21885 [Pseudonocardia xinjiangensis]|uniref:hypothetical protein n=1 Tax=Pseudonocardia xinjiangensis TaxID=75289 RepID=UPI003D911489